MTLKEANEQLEKLENEYEFYLREKEMLLTKVIPKAMAITPDKVEGGKRADKLLDYVETLEEKQINETLDYIHKKKQNILLWIDNELRILNKYEETARMIIYYKEETPKHYTWVQISQLVHYSKEQCQRIYKRYKKKRDINDNDTK